MNIINTGALDSLKAKADRTIPAIIKSVNSNNTYTILADSGQERNVKCSIPGLELKAGMNVWVTVPMGKVAIKGFICHKSTERIANILKKCLK